VATEILYFPDNDAIFFGTGRDVQIYSDGTDLVFADGGSGGTVDFQCDVAFATVTGITTLTVTTATVTGTLTPPNVTDNQLTPGVPVVLNFAVPDAATGNTEYTIADKIEIVDVTVQKRSANGGAGDTITIGQGANAITDAMVLIINDGVLVRAASIDDAYSTIPAAGTLRISWNKVTDVACQVTIFGILRA